MRLRSGFFTPKSPCYTFGGGSAPPAREQPGSGWAPAASHAGLTGPLRPRRREEPGSPPAASAGPSRIHPAPHGAQTCPRPSQLPGNRQGGPSFCFTSPTKPSLPTARLSLQKQLTLVAAMGQVPDTTGQKVSVRSGQWFASCGQSPRPTAGPLDGIRV